MDLREACEALGSRFYPAPVLLSPIFLIVLQPNGMNVYSQQPLFLIRLMPVAD